MTVSELIAVLQAMPAEAVVLYRCCSDMVEMDPDDVKPHRAEDQKIIWREANAYSNYDARWAPKGMVPDFRTVVVFPGN